MLTNKDLKRIVEICIELTNETDRNLLLSRLLQAAMEIARCDGGTIYLKKGDALEFKVMKTISQGVDRGSKGEPIDIPPVALREENVCAYAALHGELINIEDVYHSDRFDFTGPRKYDAITGYCTRSMLVIPIQNENKKLVGVMQLLNAADENGKPGTFSKDDEYTLRVLSSMAAMLILNMMYTRQIQRQMHSFVSSFAKAVDERTPYNGSHTRKVTVYATLLAEEINRRHEAGECEEAFDGNRLEQLELAATLHDIGKMIIPLEVMNKETRLGPALERIRDRFRLLCAWYELDGYKGRIGMEEAKEKILEISGMLETIEQANTAGFLPDEVLDKIKDIAKCTYRDEAGQETNYLTPEELTCLSVRKGTLTAAEREIMEDHVRMTRVILSKVYFSENYANVARMAASHHEMLDGSGYPDHLRGDALDLETRILAVADIYDALTATDRPYKKPIPRPKAFAILHDMAAEGKLEERLIQYLESAVEELTEEDILRKAEMIENGGNW